ncbi:NAD-dependent epimerase/dehydratase family protein [Hirschia litorea]|uniref:NAD-dependent epimerase/dehydratase family protein n=1 Tax=Hirschia litorea TaxID=1199156 RepID=A0ABW2IL09_9PROT
MRLFVSGGCGFVGSSLVRQAVSLGINIFNVDTRNTPQGAPQLEGSNNAKCYSQLIGDVTDSIMLSALLREFKPHALIHCAGGIQQKKGTTTTQGATATIGVLDAVQSYFANLTDEAKKEFRFIIPFDTSVFGSLDIHKAEFSGMHPINPQTILGGRAALDIALIQGWANETHIPIIYAGASALYGSWQQAEAYIPSTIRQALNHQSISIPRAQDTLDWLHIDDFANGLLQTAIKGEQNKTYLFSARSERRNIDIANNVATILDGLLPTSQGESYRTRLQEENSLPPLRCALDSTPAETKLGWHAKQNLLMGLRENVAWHLNQMPAAHKEKAANGGSPTSGLAAE